MAIQSPERAAEVINTWFSRHGELVNDSHNAMALGNWIEKFNSPLDGELVFTDASLELAYQMLATSGSLHFYASPETTAMVAQASQKAAQLAAEKKKLEEQSATLLAEKQAKEKADQKRKDNIARLDSQGSRGSTGFASADDIAAENARIQREAKEREKAAIRMQRHEQFISELAAANQMLITNVNGVKWGATEDARKAMKQALKRKYPEFASEAV